VQTLLSFILDFLFPPTEEALRLRVLLPEETPTLAKAPPSPFPFITSLFAYKDPLVSELIWSIKNKKDTHAVRCGAFALYKKLSETPGNIILIPIPISKRRRNERGYNQCELLIDEICKRDSGGLFEKRCDILFRSKDAGEQKLKDRKERLESKNIFTVKKIETGLPIIIIDDVVTTGSTLKDARDALIQAGYQNISAVALAH
jgi:ComF family protein